MTATVPVAAGRAGSRRHDRRKGGRRAGSQSWRHGFSAARSDSVDFRSRLISVLPVEMVAAYTVLDIAMRDIVTPFWAHPALIAVVMALTGFYLAAERRSGSPWVRQKRQIGAGVVGSLVYAFSLGGWFTRQPWYAPWEGLAALVVFATLLKIAGVSPEHEVRPGG